MTYIIHIEDSFSAIPYSANLGALFLGPFRCQIARCGRWGAVVRRPVFSTRANPGRITAFSWQLLR